MFYSSNTKKILFVALILNVLVWSAFIYTLLQIKAEQNRVKLLLSEVNSNAAKEENFKKIKNFLQENSILISEVDSYFVSSDGVVSFIEKLESLGRSFGLGTVIESVMVNSQNKTDFKEELRITVRVNGSWTNVMNFVASAENLPYKVTIQRINLARDEEAKNWRGALDLRVLKLKQ
ncbi:MAG TPA: type 4a pilus biogenesis protein PilO [Candidatus Paceibacterota bacterium]